MLETEPSATSGRFHPVSTAAPRPDMAEARAPRKSLSDARFASFPTDDEGFDIVPAVAVGGLRDAFLDLAEEIGEQRSSACLAFECERTQEQWLAPRGDAADVFAREHSGIVVPVRVVEAEELDALDFEAGEAPAAGLERSPEFVEGARPDRDDYRCDGGAADAPCAAPVGE